MPLRNGRSDKEIYYKVFYPPHSWDELFVLTKENSTYYELDKKANSQEEADRHWNNRKIIKYGPNKNMTFGSKECRELNKKLDEFLIARDAKWLGY